MQTFNQGTLGSKYLAELEGTQVVSAFEAAGEEAFRQYYKINFAADLDGRQRDAALRAILGDELADKIEANNGVEYGMKIPLHNHYIVWARTQFNVEPKF